MRETTHPCQWPTTSPAWGTRRVFVSPTFFEIATAAAFFYANASSLVSRLPTLDGAASFCRAAVRARACAKPTWPPRSCRRENEHWVNREAAKKEESRSAPKPRRSHRRRPPPLWDSFLHARRWYRHRSVSFHLLLLQSHRLHRPIADRFLCHARPRPTHPRPPPLPLRLAAARSSRRCR